MDGPPMDGFWADQWFQGLDFLNASAELFAYRPIPTRQISCSQWR